MCIQEIDWESRYGWIKMIKLGSGISKTQADSDPDHGGVHRLKNFSDPDLGIKRVPDTTGSHRFRIRIRLYPNNHAKNSYIWRFLGCRSRYVVGCWSYWDLTILDPAGPHPFWIWIQTTIHGEISDSTISWIYNFKPMSLTMIQIRI